MTKQMKKTTYSIKSGLIAFATAAVIGLGTVPAQAFSPALNSAATTATTAGTTIEQAGFRRHRGFRSHRGFNRGRGFKSRGFHSRRSGFHSGHHSTRRFSRHRGFRGHHFFNKSFGVHGSFHGYR